MLQQRYCTPKFVAEAQGRTAERSPLTRLREVFGYFRQGWQVNAANAKVVGQSGAYIG